MCGPAAVIIGGAMIGSQLYSGRQQRKAVDRAVAAQEEAARRERERIESGEAAIDEQFGDVGRMVDPRVGQFLDVNNKLAQSTFEQARGREDVRRASRGLVGPVNRERSDQKLLQRLALARGNISQQARTYGAGIRSNLSDLRGRLKDAVRGGGGVPGDVALQQQNAVAAAAGGLPQQAIGDVFNIGAGALNANTNAQAYANRTGRPVDLGWTRR